MMTQVKPNNISVSLKARQPGLANPKPALVEDRFESGASDSDWSSQQKLRQMAKPAAAEESTLAEPKKKGFLSRMIDGAGKLAAKVAGGLGHALGVATAVVNLINALQGNPS